MPALKDAVQGFKTGDLVITYLPRGGTRPMHVTIYLEPADSPSNTHAFIHAAPDGVVIEGIEVGGKCQSTVTPVGEGSWLEKRRRRPKSELIRNSVDWATKDYDTYE